MTKSNSLMIKLNPEFQKEIFQRIVDKYKSSIKTSQILGIPASSVRSYKNNYFKSVPKKLVNKLIKLGIASLNGLNKNTLSVFSKNIQIKRILDSGREKRKQNLKEIKEKIPSVKELISSNYLSVEEWFDKYAPLLRIPFRKLQIKKENKIITIKYHNFAKDCFKVFVNNIPRKLKLDDEFLYFFGLWCGDRAGGKRFGVTNKNENILRFVEEFLKKQHQKVEKILYITKGMECPDLKYDKKFIINKSIKGWVLSAHSNNGVLASFFYYLLSHLKEFLKLIKNKKAFFAGLFDAEGNVSLYNKSFRWACKNSTFVGIYSEFLKQLNLYDRYDGSCLITYNIEGFNSKILPHLKHNKKINHTKFLYSGDGNLPDEHARVLNFIKKQPRKTARELAKALKKNKIYSELRLLSDFNFIERESYPYRFEITSKGIESLGE